MSEDRLIELDVIDRQARVIEVAVQLAVRAALVDHRRTSDPIVVWENGNVRWVPADEILIPDLSLEP